MKINKLMYKAGTMIIVISTFFIMCSIGWTATYYVDATNGNDSNSGQSETTPWKTIAKVNASNFIPGDQILFKRGEVWSEQLTVPSSGSAGNPIIFGAYGTGNDPIIYGADTLRMWTLASGSTWSKILTTAPKQVWYNGTRLSHNSGVLGNCGSNQWDWNSDVLYVNVGESPDSGKLEVGQRNWAINTNSKNYLTIQNLTLEKANKDGLGLLNLGGTPVSGYTIDSCKIRNNYRQGVLLYGDTHNISNVYIQNCEIYYNGGPGIMVDQLVSTGLTISSNRIHENCWSEEDATWHVYTAGIRTFSSVLSGAVIAYNLIYREGIGRSADRGFGIWVDTAGPGNIVSYNCIYNNNLVGIATERTIETLIYYNLTSGNGHTGIMVSRSSHQCGVYNNVSYNNLIGILVKGDTTVPGNDMTNNLVKNNIAVSNSQRQLSATYGGENDGRNGSGNIFTYNCFGAESSNFIEWGNGVYKSTYAAWEAAYGSGTNSVEADPLFANAANCDFTLQASSPCINAGVDVGLKRDYAGNSVPQGTGVDIGALEYKVIAPPQGLQIIK